MKGNIKEILDDINMFNIMESTDEDGSDYIADATRKLEELYNNSDIEQVNHPNYYKPGAYECLDFSRYLPSALAQAFQYVWRANRKGNYKNNMEKAVFWLKDWQKNNCSFIVNNTLRTMFFRFLETDKEHFDKLQLQVLEAIMDLYVFGATSPHDPEQVQSIINHIEHEFIDPDEDNINGY